MLTHLNFRARVPAAAHASRVRAPRRDPHERGLHHDEHLLGIGVELVGVEIKQLVGSRVERNERQALRVFSGRGRTLACARAISRYSL